MFFFIDVSEPTAHFNVCSFLLMLVSWQLTLMHVLVDISEPTAHFNVCFYLLIKVSWWLTLMLLHVLICWCLSELTTNLNVILCFYYLMFVRYQLTIYMNCFFILLISAFCLYLIYLHFIIHLYITFLLLLDIPVPKRKLFPIPEGNE